MKDRWKELLKNNFRIQQNISRIDTGSEMKMMSPYLEAMTIISAAKCLKPGFAPFFLSLSFSELGMDKEKSSAGFFGPYMALLVDKITEGITSDALFGKKAELSSIMVLKKIIKFTLILAIAGGKLLQEKFKGTEREKEIHSIYTKLLFRLTAKTDIFTTTLKELILASGALEKTANNLASGLSSIGFLLMASSAANKQNFSSIVEILTPQFEKSIKEAEHLLENESNQMKAHLMSLKLSLQNEDFEEFIKAVFSALEDLGIPQNGFTEDVKSIEEMAFRLKKAISEGVIDFAKNPTEISVGV